MRFIINKPIYNHYARGLLLSLALFVFFLSSGLVIYGLSFRAFIDEFNDNLFNTAKLTGLLIDGDAHARLDDPSDTFNEDHKKIYDMMVKVIKSKPDIAYVYSMIEKDDRIYFIVDGDVEDVLPVMSLYDETPPMMMRSLKEGIPLIEEEITTDEWGSFLSAYAPIYNSAGDVVAGVGVDMRVEKSLEKMRGINIAFGAGAVVAGILSLIAGFAYARTRIKRGQQETDIRERQLKLDLVEKIVAVGHWKFDIAKQKLEWSNQTFAIHGRSLSRDPPGLEEAIEYYHPDDRQYIRGVFSRAIEERSPYRYIKRIIREDGKIRYVQAMGQPEFDAENPNKVIGVLGTFRDVTEIQEAEDKLNKALEDAVAANRAKSEFVANVSHEIRTPLGAVVGAGRLLNDTKLTQKQKSFVSIINEAGEILLNIINDILDLSKIEEGKIDIRKEIIDIEDIVRSSYALFKETAKGKDIYYELNFESKIPPSVLGDSLRIKQVLTNLISNAIKFTDHGSVKVIVSAKKTSDSASTVKFRVEDTGCGIPQSAQHRIFGKFEQIDNSSRANKKGTGLGLNICQSLVDIMGGKIGFKSEEGGGSTFWFEIDMQHCEGKASKKPSATGAKSKISGHVLIVDDVEHNRIIAREMLETIGMTSDEAENGVEALDKFSAIKYDIVLLDLRMPVMDGHETLKRMSKIIQEKKITVPIIAFTAQMTQEDFLELLQEGFDDLLAKPLLQENLEEVIKNNLSPWGSGIEGKQ